MTGHEIEVRVRYAETDQMGRAHHMTYLAWFELGRTALMREQGVPYADLERAGVFLPVARASIEYREGVGYDEVVRIRTRVSRVRSRSVTFFYEARHGGTGALLARGETELVCTGGEGRPRRFPGPVGQVLHRLAEAAAGGDREGEPSVGGEVA